MIKTGSSQAGNGVALADATLWNGNAKGLYVGGSGDLVVVLKDDPEETELTFVGAPAGYHPLNVKQVSASTTATDIIALF